MAAIIQNCLVFEWFVQDGCHFVPNGSHFVQTIPNQSTIPKPNTLDHPYSERVQFLSPHCILMLTIRHFSSYGSLAPCPDLTAILCVTLHTDESKVENLEKISGQNSTSSQINSVHNVSAPAQNLTRKEL